MLSVSHHHGQKSKVSQQNTRRFGANANLATWYLEEIGREIRSTDAPTTTWYGFAPKRGVRIPEASLCAFCSGTAWQNPNCTAHSTSCVFFHIPLTHRHGPKSSSIRVQLLFAVLPTIAKAVSLSWCQHQPRQQERRHQAAGPTLLQWQQLL